MAYRSNFLSQRAPPNPLPHRVKNAHNPKPHNPRPLQTAIVLASAFRAERVRAVPRASRTGSRFRSGPCLCACAHARHGGHWAPIRPARARYSLRRAFDSRHKKIQWNATGDWDRLMEEGLRPLLAKEPMYRALEGVAPKGSLGRKLELFLENGTVDFDPSEFDLE